MNRYKNAIIYHGRNKKTSFFEGWYFKQVSEDERTSISFIPGVSINEQDSHAFIQCIYLNEQDELVAYNIKYPMSKFSTNDEPFEVWIGNSFFSRDRIIIDIETTEVTIKGEAQFDHLTPIHTSCLHPNIMGVFSYLPKMECNHSIISMNHGLTGNVSINDVTVNLNGGKGYMEKDWGTSFPREYIWMQSNHFDNAGASLFCSVANVPFMGLSFQGFICNLVIDDKEYRFATYNRAKLKQYTVDDHSVDLILTRSGLKLHLHGEVASSKELYAPKKGVMNSVIKEGLSGTVQVELTDKKGNQLFNALGSSCGLELVSELKPV